MNTAVTFHVRGILRKTCREHSSSERMQKITTATAASASYVQAILPQRAGRKSNQKCTAQVGSGIRKPEPRKSWDVPLAAPLCQGKCEYILRGSGWGIPVNEEACLAV